MNDDVNHPSHYTGGSKEVIDIIYDALGPSAFFGFCYGNAMKYLARRNFKINHDQDIRKAYWYMTKYAQLNGIALDEVEYDPFNTFQCYSMESCTKEMLIEYLALMAYDNLIKKEPEKAYKSLYLAVESLDGKLLKENKE